MTDPLLNVAGDIIEAGTLKEVVPGIHWLRMPLPFKLDHINLWALEDDDGWTLVDTGINRDETRAAGFGEDLMQEVEKRQNPYPRRVSLIPETFRKIVDGDVIGIGGRDWRVIVGTGHSPEHACLYQADCQVLISGDQILPKITPNVSVWPQFPEMNPLSLFLGSLDRFRPLAAGTLVLPSHNWPFRGLIERLDQLAHHHDERLDDVVVACAEPQNGTQVLKHLFKRELDSHQLFFAIGESLAHLHYLIGQGRMVRETGADGVDLFRAAG